LCPPCGSTGSGNKRLSLLQRTLEGGLSAGHFLGLPLVFLFLPLALLFSLPQFLFFKLSCPLSLLSQPPLLRID
jgi:hypothetical protein